MRTVDRDERRGVVGAAEGDGRARRRRRDRIGGHDHRGRDRGDAREPAQWSSSRAPATLLASSLDYQQTLRNVAGLAVPQLADWCAVDLFDDDGAREPVAVAHVDPAKLALAERLRATSPRSSTPTRGSAGCCARANRSSTRDIPDELLVAAAIDDEHLRLLREVGMRAVLIVPLAIGGRTIGALTMVNAESGRSFDAGDVEFAEQIAARAAVAVENARLYSERSAVARTLQSSLLPEAIPQIPGWDVAALYRPAGHESEVGGDFYDLWEVGEDWLMMIGDVTGKGVGAAALTSLVRYTARAASEFDARPSADPRARRRGAAPAPDGVAVHGAVPAPVARTAPRSPSAGTRCRCCVGDGAEVGEVGAPRHAAGRAGAHALAGTSDRARRGARRWSRSPTA